MKKDNTERNIKKLKELRKKALALTLGVSMTFSMSGCSNSGSNNNSNNEASEEITTIYLDGESPEIYSIESLSNNEKRGILLSDEPHLYKSLFEKTDTKVYLTDESGNRLSDNFDEISALSDYSYLTTGGVLLGSWKKVESDKQYDNFVGMTLRKSSDGETLGPTISLLDKNGLELCRFNGSFKTLIGNIVVIEDYFEGKDRKVGEPDTYLYNYVTGKKSEKYDYVETFEFENEKREKTSYLIGVKDCVHSFYNEYMEIVEMANEKDIKEWCEANDADYNPFEGVNYESYFKSIYQNINVEKNKTLIKNDLKTQKE